MFKQSLKTVFIAFAVVAGLIHVAMFVLFVFFDKTIIYMKNGTSYVISEAHMELSGGDSVSFGALEPGALKWIEISTPSESDTSRIKIQFDSGKKLDVDTPIYFSILGDRDFLLVTSDDVVNAGVEQGKAWINESAL